MPSLHPTLAWEFYTDSPLVGMAVARETRAVLAWDASHVVYLLDESGAVVTRWVSRQPIATAAIAESGARMVVGLAEGRLLWFDENLTPGESRRAPTPLGLAVDPHGRFAMLSATAGKSLVIDCHGRKTASFESSRALLHLRFPLGAPLVVAASEAGWMGGLDLSGQVLWSHEAGVKIGGLAVTSTGGTVLAAALSHGLLRVRGDGSGSEGTYRLETLPCRVDATPTGDSMIAGSIDGTLTLLDRDGRVLWSEPQGTAIVDVALDPLGRHAWIGQQTGRIAQFRLGEQAPSNGAPTPRVARPATLCEPAWSVALPQSVEQLSSASLSLLDDSARVGAFLSDRKLRVFQLPSAKGPAASDAPIHTSDVLPGTGAMLRSLGGVTVVLTDRRLLCYDAGRNASAVFDARLAQPTHCELLGKGEMLVVLERDRLIRADVRGQQRWLKVLPEPLDHLAVFPGGLAITNDTGRLEVFDLDGKSLWRYAAFRKEPQVLAVSGELILLLGRTEKTLRAFRFDGSPVWECPVPFEPWRMFGVGRFTLIRSPDGSTLAVDPTGGRAAGAHPEVPQAWYFSLPDGRLGRVFSQAGSLSAADFAGRLLWRHASIEDLGPVAVGKRGAAAVLGSRLCWFPWERG
jgi:hypothetical protein